MVYAKQSLDELAKAYEYQRTREEYASFRAKLKARLQCWPANARNGPRLERYVMPAVWDDHDLGVNDGGE